MKSTLRTMRALMMTWVAVSALLAVSHVRAQGDLRAITYQGRLEQNSAAISGDRTLTFRLFDAETAGNQIGNPITVTVTVYAGNFATVLAPIPESAFAGGALYLEIDVEGTPLQGRQRIYSVPFALGTSRGDNMVVSGSLGLGGAAPSAAAAIVVGTGANGQGGTTDALFGKSTLAVPIGDEAAGGLTMYDAQDTNQRGEVVYASGAQQLRLTSGGAGLTILSGGAGNLAGNLTLNGTDFMFGNVTGRGDGGRVLVHDVNDTLVINYTGDFSGGTRIDGNFSANGQPMATGRYCVVKHSAAACPTGFTQANVYLDTEDDSNNDSCNGDCSKIAGGGSSSISYCCN
jgi:hypothetical protein